MTPIEYLTEKVGKIILDSEKLQNEGARLLAHYPMWEQTLGMYVEEAWDTLMKYCIRNKNATHSASVKLTFASNLIGENIARSIGIDDPTSKTTLCLGDVMIEAFLQAELIEVFREYDGYKAPYMIKLVDTHDSIKPVLIGTTFIKPIPIAGLLSDITGKPYIKGWTDHKAFKEKLDERFVKAMDILREQAWDLNEPVLDAIVANPPTKILELMDEDGVIYKYDIHTSITLLPKNLLHMSGTEFLRKKDPALQKLISKYYEYNQIVKKAYLVKDQGYPFYQEVSCDYRGRIYYAESFLEFQGSDMSRSLFLFNNKKEVNESGYRWLCIHTASCYNKSYTVGELRKLNYLKTDYAAHLESEGLDTISLDKMTLDDRYAWVVNNLKLIKSVALHKAIEEQAEKPHSFLACCLEIVGYLAATSDGGVYESGFPIPIDGSNNGWQHLAAMSKDKVAGELVSLTSTPIQKDFYVAVAKELIKIMPDWFAEKKIPMKHIRKGIAKRGSMTRAYSAGKQRIAANMYADCHTEGFTLKYGIDEDTCTLLAGNLINAINSVCAGPLKTTKYLQKIAEHELNSGRMDLSWTTPSGFPVVYKAFLQHERKQRGTIKGIIGNKDGRVTHVIKVDVCNPETLDKVPCRRSFASGISPNVVHSYDAAHMANTIVSFGGSFAAVHDSFSCHASDVDFLQDITKMTFQAQYDVENFFDILEENLMEHKRTFAGLQPVLGSLDLADLTNSDYFFC